MRLLVEAPTPQRLSNWVAEVRTGNRRTLRIRFTTALLVLARCMSWSTMTTIRIALLIVGVRLLAAVVMYNVGRRRAQLAIL